MGSDARAGVAYRQWVGGTITNIRLLEAMIDESPTFQVVGDAGALSQGPVLAGGYRYVGRESYTRPRAIGGGSYEIEGRADGSFTAWAQTGSLAIGDRPTVGAVGAAPDGFKGAVVQGSGFAVGAAIVAVVVALLFGRS